ncbi:uncharacterized protein FIBRA_03339 [Fibroporia radiculosa]|uniref:G-protein coupled receptors family 1 profile domain-containing protein n=1 Tax=Fibroporia radiculosa TaxID=599839 RepID=J4GNF3_9APHY|nr:uncharacterized protein FIBRA_03339 [Fibroporia radiculosa]CCM01290.1 predicted protein [Fibroporia radiculosa]
MSEPWTTPIAVATAFSFIGCVFVGVPLYWHLEAWNVGCIVYIFWSGSQCLIQFINMIIWRDNVINWAPVWCDITSRWRLASSIGVCTASLIINRRLYKIASVSAVSNQADRRRIIAVDLAIGIIPSIVVVALFWFIQGHRFDIYEGYGCAPEFPNTILSYFLYTAWPVVIGLISMTYCSMTLYAFYKRRKHLAELMSSNKNLTYNRYLRLMGLASIEMLCTLPLGAWVMASNARNPLYVWYGLGNLHYDFSRVDQYPAILWWNVPQMRSAILFNIWDIISCTFVFFAFFGCAEEARRHYQSAITSVAKRIGISTSFLSRSGSGATGSFGYAGGSKPTPSALGRITIPTFSPRKRRDSDTSFSDRLSTSISLEDTPIDDRKLAPYSPSQRSAGSSTFIPSPCSPKFADEKYESFVLPASPPPVHDTAALARLTPDVPSPVRRDSMEDIV